MPSSCTLSPILKQCLSSLIIIPPLQVEWRAPRPMSEFLFASHAFFIPKTGSKWGSRIKNNLYYYR